MKDQIAQAAAETGHNWVGLILTGLGVSTMGLPDFIGGLILAVAMASFVAQRRKSNRKIWAIVGVAAVFGIIAGSMYPHLGIEWPVQVVMALAGAASSFVLNTFVAVGNTAESKGGAIADRAIDHFLPGKGEDE